MINTQSTQPFDPFSRNLSVVKKSLRRPSVMLLGILQVVSLIIGFVFAFLSVRFIYDITNAVVSIPEIARDLTNDDYFALATLTSNNVYSYISMIPSLLISALIAFAIIYIYVKSKNDSPLSKPTAGVTILFVFSIISLVFACFAAITFLVVMGAGAISIASISHQADISFEAVSAIRIALVSFEAVYAILGFLILFFYINLFRFISSVRKSLTSISLSAKGAKPFGVSSVLYGVFSVLTLLGIGGFIFLFAYAYGAAYPYLHIDVRVFIPMFALLAVLQLVQTIQYFALAKIAFGYNKDIKSVTTGGFDGYAQPNVTPQSESVSAPMPNTVCPRCGGATKPSDEFCNYCGNKLR